MIQHNLPRKLHFSREIQNSTILYRSIKNVITIQTWIVYSTGVLLNVKDNPFETIFEFIHISTDSNYCEINDLVHVCSKIKKEEFIKTKNNELEPEPFVDCQECGRKLHQVCVLHMSAIWPNGFTCDNCHKQTGSKRKENKYTARRKYFVNSLHTVHQ